MTAQNAIYQLHGPYDNDLAADEVMPGGVYLDHDERRVWVSNGVGWSMIGRYDKSQGKEWAYDCINHYANNLASCWWQYEDDEWTNSFWTGLTNESVKASKVNPKNSVEEVLMGRGVPIIRFGVVEPTKEPKVVTDPTEYVGLQHFGKY